MSISGLYLRSIETRMTICDLCSHACVTGKHYDGFGNSGSFPAQLLTPNDAKSTFQTCPVSVRSTKALRIHRNTTCFTAVSVLAALLVVIRTRCVHDTLSELQTQREDSFTSMGRLGRIYPNVTNCLSSKTQHEVVAADFESTSHSVYRCSPVLSK